MLIKYDKLEAMKNKCYPISYGGFTCLIILISVILLLLFIFSPFFNITIGPFTSILIVFLILIGVPILLIKWYLNKIKWFSLAFVLQNESWYLVQLISHNFKNKVNVIYPEIDILDDNNYMNMLDKWLKHEKIDGEVIKLENILLVKESQKYYYYSYINNGVQKKLKIPKAYNNLISLLR